MRQSDGTNAQYYRRLRYVKLALGCAAFVGAFAVFARGGSDVLAGGFLVFGGICLDLPIIAVLERVVPWGKDGGAS